MFLFLFLLGQLGILDEMERERFIRLGEPRWVSRQSVRGIIEQLVAAQYHTRRGNCMRLGSCGKQHCLEILAHFIIINKASPKYNIQ